MALQLFDIDYDLQEDPDTKDLKELYNEDAINQSIDLWLSHPYRIGVGNTNTLINYLFTDLIVKTEQDIANIISREFDRNYQMIRLLDIDVVSELNKRRIYVKLEWELKNYDVSGIYTRFWYS